MKSYDINIALAGNPNSGKTTLFNELTGARQYVGNWAGVTVEKKEGKLKFEGKEVLVTDLPGTYSLSPYSMEEVVTRKYIVDENPEVIVNIVDASNIERNLYLTTQIIELGKPMVVALNMMDVAEKRGYKIDVKKLEKELDIPVIPIVASKGKGVDELMEAVLKIDASKKISKRKITYGEDVEKKISEKEKIIKECGIDGESRVRWYALKALEDDKEVIENLNIETTDSDEAEYIASKVAEIRYEFINKVINKSVNTDSLYEETLSDKVDKIITNPILGIPIFALMMYFVFYFTFDLVGNRLQEVVDAFFSGPLTETVTLALDGLGVAEWLKALVTDGIIAGVGGVLVFLPNIACLFLAISILEDSGYMARVAFIMDRVMRKVGLSGKAFIPLILGFGCNVPAIMGTRALEDENDRMTAILINPFISCAARSTVYTMIAGIFFKGNENIVAFSLYFLGILVAVIAAFIFKKTLFKGEEMPFIMELPPYRVPTIKGTGIHIWERVKGFIVNAGTLIFGASIVLWFVLNFNAGGLCAINESFGASVGKFIAPIFAPLGFGSWEASLSIISGVVAKEVVVSNMNIIYGLSTDLATVLPNTFTQLSSYSFMVFVLLYTPCVATIAVIKKETNSWKWTAFSVAYQVLTAWVVSFIIYNIGKLFLGA